MSLEAPARVRQRPIGLREYGPSPLSWDERTLPVTPAERRHAQPRPLTDVCPPTSSTIRHLRVAFQETPPHLKELEDGWRVARKGIRDDVARLRGETTEFASDQVVSERTSVGQDQAQAKAPRRVRYEEPEDVITRQSQSGAVGPSLLPTPPSSPLLLAKPPANAPPPAVPAPTSKPERPNPQPCIGTKRQSLKPHADKQPSCILANPLPPTPRTRLSHKGTITIHDINDPHSITITLADQVIRISHSGDSVLINKRSLHLSSSSTWRKQDHALWSTLSQLVEDLKRRTARIKVYTPLGTLAITCSTPPDIILSFGHETRVRLRYSLSRLRAEVDTVTRTPTSRYKTHRVIPLHWGSGTGTGTGSSLGLNTDGWGDAEIEAVKRLWELRDEWARFVPGYDSTPKL